MGRVGVVNRGTGPGVGAVPRLERLSALNSRLWIAPPPPREDSEFQTLGRLNGSGELERNFGYQASWRVARCGPGPNRKFRRVLPDARAALPEGRRGNSNQRSQHRSVRNGDTAAQLLWEWWRARQLFRNRPRGGR